MIEKALHSRGLKRIPEYVATSLTPELKQELGRNGFGLSFPCISGCQMRLIRNGEDLGGFYSYKQFGSVSKAIQAAINKSRMLKLAYNNQKSKSNFVYLVIRYDKRKDKFEWRYQVSYTKAKRVACKTFSMGHKEPSPEKLFHTFQTASLFRFYFDELGSDFDERCFLRWKHVRLYMAGDMNFDWENA